MLHKTKHGGKQIQIGVLVHSGEKHGYLGCTYVWEMLCLKGIVKSITMHAIMYILKRFDKLDEWDHY